jgi:trehalose synthase
MSLVHPVEVVKRPVARLAQVIGDQRHARLVLAAGGFRERLAGRTIWNVSSTAVGGGVAEMLQVLVGYAQDLDIPIRWAVITGGGVMGMVTSPAAITGDGRPGPDDPLVVQVSRWDRLKDMSGVMAGFARHVVPSGGGYLVLAGPAVTGVSDDPEGAAVFRECLLQWSGLPAAARARILLVTLPLDDVDENAVMVNALQRHATVITQKSLAEGFGLTVAEGMWKARPVVGSAVGGIINQITDGTGILLTDPRDEAAFGAAVRQLLDDPGQASRMGRAAQAHIREHYMGDLHLLRYERPFSALLTGG